MAYRSPWRGLWERWKDRGTGDTVQTFTIITTVPNELWCAIHDRMPVILQRDKWATWLGEHEADPDELRWMVLRPYRAALMRAYPVDVRVGNVRNNDAALLHEISLAA
jgi:putative SOS response-associated peptidase YedK